MITGAWSGNREEVLYLVMNIRKNGGKKVSRFCM